MTIRIRRPSTGVPFIHPLDPEPRTAVLAGGFRQTRLVRIFPQGWNEQAARFNPTSIAGPLDQLRRAARVGVRLEHAVVAFTYAGDSGLSHADREMFWAAFGVPVFEQYLGPKNQLLAAECDAHCGLHVVSGCADFDLDYDPCACGNGAPRLPRGARIDELVALLA
jgi:hypothetical protein